MSIFLGKCQWLDDGVRQKLYTHNFYVNCNVSLDVKTKVHDCLSIMQPKSPPPVPNLTLENFRICPFRHFNEVEDES